MPPPAGSWVVACPLVSKVSSAHILCQVLTGQHVGAHWHMLVWAAQRHNAREIFSQIFRIVGAATKTAIGLMTQGNTGFANVSRFRRMPISGDLADIPAAASKKYAYSAGNPPDENSPTFR